MKIVRWLVGIVAAVAALVLLGGFLLSPTFTVDRSTVVDAPPEKIYPLVADPKRWKDWAVWHRRDPSMKVTYFGTDQGVGAGWAWESHPDGAGRMVFTASEAPTRVAYDLFFPDFDTTSTGEMTLVAASSGTRVTWSLNGDVGANPVYRWMTLFLGDMIGADFDAGLANLKTVVEAS